MSRANELKRQIAQLEDLIRSGVLQGEAAQQARARLEQQLLAQVSSGADAADAAAGAALDDAASEFGSARPSMALKLGIVGFVLAVGVAGWAALGSRDGLTAATRSSAAAASSDSHELGSAQIEAMAQRLAERLKERPGDGEGWLMLGRTYSALGRHADALPAYRRAVELLPNEAQGWADLADAVGTANGRSLDGEPEQLIAKALALDGNNVKALSLAGTVSFNRGDHAGAVRLWEQAIRNVEPGSPMAGQLEGALAEARTRAGMPAAPAAAPKQVAQAAPPAAAAQPAATAGASIQGRVTLSAALKSQAAPNDTVYVFARAMQGGKAPLAILRKQVKDLPLDFTLDDSLSMSPAMRLSGATEVQVGARISKSGQPMPQPGDLQGLVGPVAVGARGVALEISETIR